MNTQDNVKSVGFSRVNSWLEARRGFVMILLILSAVAVRGMYLAQIWNSPVAWMHNWEETDMSFFDSWARQIASGDWLTSKPAHPYPQWSMETAARYLKIYPEEKARLERSASADAPGLDIRKKLWNEWYCAPCFHQGPAYPYLVAVTYRIFGPDPRAVFVWQMVLGVIATFLLYKIALYLFDDLTAFLAGIIFSLYGPSLLYEGVLLRASLIVFASLLVLYSILLSLGSKKCYVQFLAGLSFGFALVVKKIFFPVTILFVLFLLFRSYIWRREERIASPVHDVDGMNPSLPLKGNGIFSEMTGSGLLLLAAFLAGLSVFLLPVVFRNVSVGAPPLALSSVNAFVSTFINSNAADSAPWQGYCISGYFAEIAGRSKGSVDAVVETLKTHDSAADIIFLFWKKWLALWQWYEQPNNVNFYYYQLHAPVLAFMPFTFLTIAPLGILGFCIGFKRIVRLWPLFLMVAMYFGILMLGLVLARYRVALAVLLIPFAASGIVWIAGRLGSVRWKSGAVAVLLLVLMSLVTMRPLDQGRPLIRSAYYSAAYSAYYSRLALAEIQDGNWEGAAYILTLSLAYEPAELRKSGDKDFAINDNASALAGLYAQVHGRIAEAWRNAGENEKAAWHEARSLELEKACGGKSDG